MAKCFGGWVIALCSTRNLTIRQIRGMLKIKQAALQKHKIKTFKYINNIKLETIQQFIQKIR